jgi:ribosomal protein S18 acetylase RimI-like enzyme
MIIDEATFPDVSQMCELLALLFAQEHEFPPDKYKQRTALNALVCNPQRGRIFVLRDDETVLGMVSIQIVVSTACGGDVLLLENLVVSPACRNRGYGSALLDHTVDFARHSGFKHITLMTDPLNFEARRFCARHGFLASDLIPCRMLL